MSARYLRKLPSCFLGMLLCACATTPSYDRPAGIVADAAKPAKIEPDARPLYFQAERAFDARNFSEAQRLFQSVRARFPRGRAQVYAAYRLGIIYYHKEQYAAAAREFEYFLARLPQNELTFDATYNLAASEFQQGRTDKAYQILSRLKSPDIQAQGPRRAETVYQLMARCAAAMGNNVGAIVALSSQLQLPLEDSVRSNVSERIHSHLGRISDKRDMERLLAEVSEPVTRAKIIERFNAYALAERSVPIAPAPSGLPEESQRPREVLLPGGTTGDRFSVGVLLPLTGRWASYGRRALDAILLASKVYSMNPDLALQLSIRDTASSPLMAQQAVDELVNSNRVIALIGPLNWKESLAVAQRAQALGVLNLSLATKEGISERGAYLFQNALTARVQLESLVRYCTGERRLARFGILAPDNAFGTDMTQQFWDLVEKYGGKVVAYQSYEPNEKDFQSHVQQLTGLTDPNKYRKLESTALAEFIQEQKDKGMKVPKVRLPAVLDFDALFIPDSPRTVGQIAPVLGYFDVTGVALLGTTEWNTDQLYKRGGRYVEGAIFPGGVSLTPKTPKQQEFLSTYVEAFGSQPDLIAAQAFEAMELVVEALRRSTTNDRNEVVNQLAGLKDFDSPLGRMTFDDRRVAQRRLPVVTLELGGQLVEH